MSTRQKIQALIEATARGEAALAGGYGEKAAARELTAALQALGEGVDAVWADELTQGVAMLEQLKRKLSRLDDATVRTIRPCPSCRSTELLLADSYCQDRLGIEVAMLVCPQCGETRMWCPRPAVLRTAKTELGEPIFRSITVPDNELGPFR